MSALELIDIHKSFGATAVVEGAAFTVESGSITAMVGPSGSGKTTILRLIAGFERPDAGTIAIGDTVVASVSLDVAPEHRRIGYVPQEGALFPHLSVARNVGFGLARGAASAARVAECLELVGMSAFASRRPHELSGGQQQRVALARALAPRPRLVLMDEPFSALDAAMRPEVCADVVAALRADGATALVVTHDREEALAVADRMVVVMEARVQQCADPITMYRSPASPSVAAFLGAMDIVSGRIVGDRVVTDVGEFPLAGRHVTGDVDVLIRPGQVSVFPRIPA